MKAPLLWFFEAVSISMLLAWLVLGQVPAEVVDRIAAIVNEEIITESDVGLAMALDAQRSPDTVASRPEVLKRLIAERLIVQESKNAPPVTISQEALADALQKVQEPFPSTAAFDRLLRRYGITRAEFQQQIRKKLWVLKLIDQRFRPFIMVTADEIQEYYDKEFRTEMRRRTSARIPELAAVRDQIEAILTERKLNQETERWMDDLRKSAVIRF
ncbi:MAG: SurA N-terminal domain-containing protein [Acidobacteria bacterium]|nr:SurA N-terminal domain-containing protein [Acidobacteriota bacterium]MBI3655575.1 SurA N-terminal domain-containing protein [Acidobacteriota bacterium]